MIVCITSATTFALSQNLLLSDRPTLTYLERVYPLEDKNQLNREFFDSLVFYGYAPLATVTFLKMLQQLLNLRIIGGVLP